MVDPFQLPSRFQTTKDFLTSQSAHIPVLGFLLNLLLAAVFGRRYYYNPIISKLELIGFDTEMSFHTLKPVSVRLTQWLTLRSVVVVELKYAADDDDGAVAVMEFLPLRRSRNSKYITEMRLEYLSLD